MVDTIKFSEFIDAGNPGPTQDPVGLSSGVNARFTTWLPIMEPGPTGDRPAIAPDIYYRLRFNTSLDVLAYEYYSPTSAEWIQLNSSGDVDQIYVALASHVVGFGAALIGLEDQSGVTEKTVQDLANATIVASTDNGTLTNGVFLSNIPTGILASTTSTGALISRILTGTANQIDIASGDGTANPTFSVSSTLNLPGTFNIQSTTAISAIINDDTFAAAAATNIPTALSVKNYVLSSIAAGAVASVQGTADQVLVNSTSGSPVTGALTLTLPTSIAIDSIIGRTAATPLTITPIAGQNLNIVLSTTGDFAVNTNQLYVDTSATNVGLGTSTPANKLSIVGNLSVGSNLAAPSNGIYCNGVIISGPVSTAANSQIYASGAGVSAISVRSFYAAQQVQATTTTSFEVFSSAPTTAASSFTLTDLRHFVADQGTIGATSAVTNQAGFTANATLTGATNNYGFRGLISSGTNRWNLNMSGTAQNFLQGNTGIGTGMSAPVNGLSIATNLSVGGNTAAPTNGIYSPGIIICGSGSSGSQTQILASGNVIANTSARAFGAEQTVTSATTNNFFGFHSLIGTAAAGFTLASLYHFIARQSTIGGGSNVTAQYGYFVESTLTGAASNYAFYGDIAAAANRWNLYMNGTGQNWLAGFTGIGAGMSVPVNTLSVGGSASIGSNTAAPTNGIFSTGKIYSGSTSTATDGQFVAMGNAPTTVVSYGFADIQTVTASTSSQYTAFISNVSIAAAATVAGLIHFSANVNSFGAGAALSTQTAFYTSTLGNATSNYGFRGQIAASANNFNLIMDGSAVNFLAANLSIGGTLQSSNILNVSGIAIPDGFAAAALGGSVSSSVTNTNAIIARITTSNVITIGTLVNYLSRRPSVGGTLTVGTLIGYDCEDLTTGISLSTSCYGLRLQNSNVSNAWNIYIGGAAPNFLGTGQTVIGGTTPNPKALLTLTSTTQAIQLMTMTTAQKNAIGNGAGLFLFDSTLNQLSYNTGAAWVNL